MTGTQVLPVLEIGGTHVTVACVDLATREVVSGTLARRDLDGTASTEELVGTVVGASAHLRGSVRPLWGVAIPGPFDYERGIGHFRGVGKFAALRDVDLGAVLRHRLTFGRGVVHFVNDAQAFLMGEWLAGAASGHRRAVGVTLGTGVGSAFLADGAVVEEGPGVPPQGYVYRLRLAGRPLEETVSRRAICRRYAALRGDPGQPPTIDLKEITEYARAGDELAALALREPLEALGEMLASRVAAFGASVLVVGGSVARSWDVIGRPLRSGADRASPGSADIEPGRLLDEAPLLGAASHAATKGR